MDDDVECGDGEFKFKINQDYASRYDQWRAKEEYEKLKAKYGDVKLNTADDKDSDSSSSEEDEQKLTPHLEREFLRTLAALKSKDPKIYDPKVTFFEHESNSDASGDENEVEKNKSKKPMYLKDYEREVISKREGKFSDDDSDNEAIDMPKPANYYEEQEAILQSFKTVASADDSDTDNLLSVRVKTKAEQQREEEEYLEWLKGQKDTLSGDKTLASELQPLRSYWNNPSLDEGEQFLRDYLLNKRYVDEDDEERIPSYDEVIRELEEDEEQLEREEQFEREFNFRYEEPDASTIKSYPRVIPESLRNKDTRRIEKRKEKKERKSMYEEKKREELKRLKNFKKREIMEKIEKLKEITGIESIGFSEQDIDGDFNAEEYDRLMKKVFSEEYYGEKDGKKPVFSDLESEEENWDEWAGREAGEQADDEQESASTGLHCDDPGFVMDCDYDPSQKRSRKVERDKTTNKRKRKKSRFAQLVEKPKPSYNEKFTSFSEYLDQYYNLDYEDIVADIPVRFKYRKVTPNDFGLSVDEVLAVPDQELNQWASVKKMSQYRTDEEEQRDVSKYKKKGRNWRNKLNVLTSLQQADESNFKAAASKFQHRSVNNDGGISTQKAKQHQTKNATNVDLTTPVPDEVNKKRKRHGLKDVELDSDHSHTSKKRKISDNQAESPVDETKKVKRDKTVVSSVDDDNSSVNVTDSIVVGGTATTSIVVEHDVSAPLLKKKKKKKKGKTKDVESVDVTVPMSDVGKKAGKKKHKPQFQQISEDRLKAYGINPKKFKYVHLKNLQKNEPN